MVCQKLSLYNDIRHKTIGAVKIYCSAWVFRTVLVDWTLLLTFSPSSVLRPTCRAGGCRGAGARACTVLGQPFPAVKWRRGPAAAAASLSRLTWSLVWNNTEHGDIAAGISSCCGNGTELRTAGQKMLVRTQLGRNQRTPHTRPHTSTHQQISRYGRK